MNAAGPAIADDGTGSNGRAIRWMLTGVPPKLILDGPLRGTGYGEQQIAFLTQHLPQFSHHLEAVTPARLWHEMRSSPGVCSIDIADLPEREKWAIFTRHHTSLPSYRVLVLKDRLPEFAEFRDAAGQIDLDRLGASERLTGIFIAGRHYMTLVNDFIDNPARKSRLDAMTASTKIFEMIAGRRGDYGFAAVTEMNYFNALNATASGEKRWPPLATLAIKGAEDQVHGHIACTRDLVGTQAVEAIDRLFDDASVWSEFFALEQRWLSDLPTAGR